MNVLNRRLCQRQLRLRPLTVIVADIRWLTVVVMSMRMRMAVSVAVRMRFRFTLRLSVVTHRMRVSENR